MRKTSGLSIDIQSATHLALAPTWDWIRAPVGDGFFTLEEDRVKLADVLEKMLHAKLKACLKQGDYHGYRLMLNMQQIHLRRLPTQPVEDVVPGFDSDRQDPAIYVLERFLHQNGFRSAKCRDAEGWSPLSYAALSGDPMLIASLLEQGADPNEGIEKFEPIFHFTPGTRALHISAFLGNNEGIRLLLERGADVQAKDNYDATPLHWAALGSNVEGIQVLCAADASCATFANVLGYLPLTMACMAPSVASMWELLPHTPKQELDVALHASILHGLPSAGMISALIEAGANVDARPATPLFTARGMLFAVLGVRHRFSESTLSTYAYYHCNATPLMCSVLTCAFEATEALLAAGARTDLRNSRGRSAADLAKETSAPSYILAALKEAVA